jgi:uncharacterized protein YegL
MIQSRKEQFRSSGVSYYRPWVFMLTDGAPQGDDEEDMIRRATQRIAREEGEKRVSFFAVGVENANMERLKQIALRAPIKLHGLNFTEMFVWLSASMQRISHSETEEQVALPPPGWGAP